MEKLRLVDEMKMGVSCLITVLPDLNMTTAEVERFMLTNYSRVRPATARRFLRLRRPGGERNRSLAGSTGNLRSQLAPTN